MKCKHYDTTVISDQVNHDVRMSVYRKGVREYDLDIANSIGDEIRKNIGFVISNRQSIFWLLDIVLQSLNDETIV